ncbi:MAG: ABC transporter ATP-binding protein [bacterium]
MAKKEIEQTRVVNPWPHYKRLVGYALRYRGYLIIGVVSGMLCGGSLFGLLQMSPQVLGMIEGSQVVTPLTGVASGSVADAPAAGGGAPAEPAAHAPKAKVPGWQKEAQKWADKFHVPLTTADGRLTWQAVVAGLILLPLIVGLRLLAMYLNQYCLRWLGARVVRDLRNDLFVAMESQSLKYHGRVDVGRLISRNIADTTIIEHVINSSVSEASRAPFEIAGALAFMFLFSREHHMFGLLAVMVISFPLFVVPLVILGRRVRVWTRRALERISDLVSLMHENLTCIRVVKAFHMEAAEAVRFGETNKRYFKTVMRAVRVELLMGPLMEAVAIILSCAFLVLCFTKQLSLSEIIPIGAAALLVYRPVRSLAKIVPTFERGAAAQARIFETLDLDIRLPEAVNPVGKLSFDDRVVFEDVSFQYATAGEPVIRHATFTLPRGGMVAVVGATGSGKTTLANLLARFYDPTEGCVRLDGRDLRDIRVADVRKLVGILTQETLLFNETIAYNIAYGTEGATPAAIEAAAEKANAHAFISAHPDGYNRVVGEKGFVLSGGERQRVAIARIMLRNPPILILDEATSALDTVTERQVQEEIARAMANRTTFAIAHRLSTIRRASLILVVDKGEIVERGTHDELYAAGGAYRRLCDMQFSDRGTSA